MLRPFNVRWESTGPSPPVEPTAWISRSLILKFQGSDHDSNDIKLCYRQLEHNHLAISGKEGQICRWTVSARKAYSALHSTCQRIEIPISQWPLTVENCTGASIRNWRLSWPERGKPWSLLLGDCVFVGSPGLSPAPGRWVLGDNALCRRAAVVDRLRISPFIFCKQNKIGGGNVNTRAV